MTDKIGGRDSIAGLQSPQQMQQAGDLCGIEGLEAIIVQLDPDGDGIDVGDVSPSADAGLPGPQVVVQHMMHGAVLTDDIVGAHLRSGHSEGLQGLGTAVLSRMMYDHEVGLA